MIYLVIALIALAVTLLTVGVAFAATSGQGRVIRQRLATLRNAGGVWRDADQRRRRVQRRERLESLLGRVGERISGSEAKMSSLRRRLVQAGWRNPRAPVLFMGLRVVLAVGFYAAAGFLIGLTGMETLLRFLLLVTAALLGWMLPFMILKRKGRARTRALQSGLADAIDILVVCVEAGLGLNQALMRVADEMGRVSPAVSEELTMVALEMRAGTPRDEALQNMAERTGLQDVRSWVNMMVQTERFGTSIAESLRVHADTMRTKRRQRAEEAASKLTVKLLIPLVMFVFPALFVVILGPGILIFSKFMGSQ